MACPRADRLSQGFVGLRHGIHMLWKGGFTVTQSHSQTTRPFRVILRQAGTDEECEAAVERALRFVAQSMRQRHVQPSDGGRHARRHLQSG